MRVLLDECVPRQLKRDLHGHSVRTVGEMRWAGVKNGELLRRAVREFDAVVTTDRRMEFQQNVRSIGMRVVVIIAARNDVDILRPLMPRVLQALKAVRPGEVRRVRA